MTLSNFSNDKSLTAFYVVFPLALRFVLSKKVPLLSFKILQNRQNTNGDYLIR